MSDINNILKTAATAGKVPGVVAAAATKDGIFYQGAYGKRSLAAAQGMTTDTVFRIFSMTKAITTLAAAQLIERGQLTLDTKVEDIVPAWADKPVLEGFDGDTPRTRPARSKATIRHLATHTAGLSYEIWDENIAKYLKVTDTPSILGSARGALDYPLVFDPGEKWAYGINIDWLGHIVETVSRKTLDQYCRENIFAPLGMRDTGFYASDTMRLRLAGAHRRAENGELEAMELDLPPPTPELQCGGHGLFSTASDYMQFLLMLLNNGTYNGARILKPETVGMMTENQIGDLRVTEMKTVMPHLSNNAEFFPGMPKTHNLGFVTNLEQAPGRRNRGSHCWAGLANTYYWWDPKAGVAGVILQQILPFVDPEAIKLYEDFEKAVYASLG